MTEVEIVNLALSWLGEDPIIAFTDDSTVARWCNLNYPGLRDAVLQTRTWTFATVRVESNSIVPPVWGGGFAHTPPPEWLMLTHVYRSVVGADPNQWKQSKGWRREGVSVIALEEDIFMQGLDQIVDPLLYPPLFTQALAARIAADGAIPFTENRQLQADMWGLYNDKLHEAAARDGQQGTSDVIKSNTLIDARWSGASGRGW
jgi:hypothetical protein